MARFFKLCYCVNWEGGVLFPRFNLLKKKKPKQQNNKQKPVKKLGPFSFLFHLKTHSSMNETSPNNCIPLVPRELTYFISIYNEKNKYHNLSIIVASFLLPPYYYFFNSFWRAAGCNSQLCAGEALIMGQNSHAPSPHIHVHFFFSFMVEQKILSW